MSEPNKPAERTDYNEPLELAKQRVDIVARVMKLPYIKATRDTEVGPERFVARDDLIKAVHDYAVIRRADAPTPEPPVEPRIGDLTSGQFERLMNESARFEEQKEAFSWIVEQINQHFRYQFATAIQPPAQPSADYQAMAREWLSRDASECYFSYIEYCKEDREGMVKELAALLERVREAQLEQDAKVMCIFCRATTDKAVLLNGEWVHYATAVQPTPCEAAAIRRELLSGSAK
jgi:hypothetical protein